LFVRGGARVVCMLLGSQGDAPRPGGTSVSARPRSSGRFDPSWLFSREPEYPNDAPTWEEMRLWFASCLALAFGVAAAGGLALEWLWRLRSRGPIVTHRRLGTWFWGTALVLGLLGPNLFSEWADRCLFTWPACLYAALHLTVQTCLWADSNPERKGARWLARLSIVALALVGLGYFELCKAVGTYISWSFLCGLLPAFPVTLLAARASLQARPLWQQAAWSLLGFTLFFWTAEGIFLWKQ
jgi:hypothetical protein